MDEGVVCSGWSVDSSRDVRIVCRVLGEARPPVDAGVCSVPGVAYERGGADDDETESRRSVRKVERVADVEGARDGRMEELGDKEAGE